MAVYLQFVFYISDIIKIGERKAIYQVEIVPEEQLCITISGECALQFDLWLYRGLLH